MTPALISPRQSLSTSLCCCQLWILRSVRRGEEQGQTEESISTCRFAQRVSTIKNDARINEDVDPGVLIRMLRSNNAALEDEVAFLKVHGVRRVTFGGRFYWSFSVFSPQLSPEGISQDTAIHRSILFSSPISRSASAGGLLHPVRESTAFRSTV